MKHVSVCAIIVCVVVFWVLSGCRPYVDDPQPVPMTIDMREVKDITVSSADSAEPAAVTALETARVNYKYRLEVLKGYYEKVGNMDKHNWAREELENLNETQKFRWVGAPQVLAPQGESLEGADERMLVEYVIAARNTYTKAVSDLVAFYDRTDATFKAKVIRNLQTRFHPARTHMYFLDAEIPGPELRPVEVIPAADALYDKAVKLYRSAKVLPGITDYPKMRQALVLLRQMVREYPKSTKIALAAYFIGEIYKEYFNENLRAVKWYERAWQWDPNITEPARFQAAAVHDFRLQNKAKAVECYRAAIQHEQFNSSNVRYAHQRVRELTEP